MSQQRSKSAVGVSKTLVAVGSIAFAVIALAPVFVMFMEVSGEGVSNLLDERTLSLLGRTLTAGLGAAGVAILLGAPYGWIVSRTNVYGRDLLRPLGLLPLILPPLYVAMTWSQVSDIRGALGTILSLGFGSFPLVALFTAKAAERIDARHVEAALLTGGPGTALRAEWALLAPAAACGACLAFAFAINDFAVPDYVSSVGPKFNVYADEVFSTWQTGGQTGVAVARALPLVLLTLAALIPALALRRRGALSAASLEGDFRRPAPLSLGAWRIPSTLFCVAAFALGAGVPLALLFWEAGGGPRGFTGSNLHAAFSLALESARDDVKNSLLWSAAAATLCLPIGLILGHALERLRSGRWFEPLCILPLAVPAVLFGIGEIVLWNRAATSEFYASGGMVILLYAGRFSLFAILACSGATAMLSPKLEEAASLSGAGPLQRLKSIVAPALAPALIGSWTLVFVLSMRELDAAILVPAANRTAIFRVYNLIHFGRDDHVAALSLLVVFFIALPGLLWAVFGRRKLEFLP